MGIVKNSLYKLSDKRLMSLFKKQTIFPYYHIINNEKVSHIKNLYEYKNTSQFKKDLDFLMKYYNPIDPGILFTGKVPDNSFLLSFDDGLEEIYSIVFPILKEKGVKAIFFINPDFVDNKNSLYKHDISVLISYLEESDFDIEMLKKIGDLLTFTFSSVNEFIVKLKSTQYADRHKIREVLKILKIDIDTYLIEQKPYVSKEEINEMLDAGFYFGGHTMSHPPLNQLAHENQKDEIIASIEWLRSNFDINYSVFAFPFTDRNVSKKLLEELFEYDSDILLFGNSGLKKDIDKRIIHRFSLEHPSKFGGKQIISENLYKYYNKLIGKYKIKRR